MAAKKTTRSSSGAKRGRAVVGASSSVKKRGIFSGRRGPILAFAAFAIIGGVIATYLSLAATNGGQMLTAVTAGKCIDNASNVKANGNKIRLWGCNGTPAQKWRYTTDQAFVNANGYCLDVKSAGKATKTLVQLYQCNGTPAQKWVIKSNGSLVNPNSGLCLDDKYAGTADGTQIWIWPCNGTKAQKWTLDTAVTAKNTSSTNSTATSTATSTTTVNGSTTTQTNTQTSTSSGTTVSLFDPVKKEIANELVSSAENSSLNWKAQYGYIEDIGDSRGYTAGIIGFCTGCGDLLKLVQYYTQLHPGNVLEKYIPALKKIGSFNPTHAGLDPTFTKDWKTAAQDPKFQQAQNDERDRAYFNPAVNQGIADGLHALGQFIYYDAMVVHGPGSDSQSFGGIRAAAMRIAKTPAQGGNETTYLNAFMDVRVKAMKAEAAHEDVTRIENAQRAFLKNGNLNLDVPLSWSVYGDPYSIKTNPKP